MLIYEYKLAGNKVQYEAIDEAIRVTQFIRNKALRLWMDTRGINRNDLQCSCSQLAKDYGFVARLNSQARQAAADRAWAAITRFYDHCNMTTARATSRGRRAIPNFSTIIEAWNTSRRGGDWNRMASTSPSPMGATSDAYGW
jgi:putative transposase